MFEVVVKFDGQNIGAQYPEGKHALAAAVLKDAYEHCLKRAAQADLAGGGVQVATTAQLPPVPEPVQRRLNGR